MEVSEQQAKEMSYKKANVCSEEIDVVDHLEKQAFFRRRKQTTNIKSRPSRNDNIDKKENNLLCFRCGEKYFVGHQNGSKAMWEKKHYDAFNMLKRELSSESVLAFYDPHKEVQLITNASNHAIGGILLQKERTWSKPICYISSRLVIVDHKPLKFIFCSGSKLNARITRWQIKLQANDFDVIYQKEEENIADFISRNCTPNEILSESDENEITAYVNFLVTKMAPKSVSLEDIKSETAIDISLITIKAALLSGCRHDNPILEPYCKFQNELTDLDGIILRGEKVVLPKTLQKKALRIVHKGHLSVEKCKGLLRQKVYWVTMNTDI
nr:uncharacterized protein LOC124817154 [Hydra vulgaris]